MNTKYKTRKALLAVILLLTTIFTSSFTLLSVSAAEVNSSEASQDVGKAYYDADYEYLDDENSVFQSITLEEAIYLFQQKGNYLILLGGSWCGNTTAVIDYINEAAKVAGVETIYNLDLRLDGTNSDTHIRETNGKNDKGATYNYLYGELVTKYLTNLNDWVEYTVDSKSALTYTNADGVAVTVPKVQVPFLFLYNKDNTVDNSGKEDNGYHTTYPIVYGFEKMLNRDENGLYTASYGAKPEGGDNLIKNTYDSDTYVQELNNAIFDHIGTGEGKVTLSSFTDADYIRLAYNERSGKTIFEANEQINIRTLTYKQLEWLLGQEGNYLILLGGAWCGNTQAIIDIVNDYAVANNVIVYNFDTKLDGGYAKKYWGYTGEVHIRDSKNVFANLYVDLVNEYFDNIETEYTIESGNYISYQTDPEDESTKVISNKLQVPYFLAYNKDIVDNDGHDTPILSYVEKMYVLDEASEDYIGSETNYADYTTATFNVIKAYAEKIGITATNIVMSTSTDNDDASGGETNSNITDTDSNGEKQEDKGGNDTITKIILAIVGVVVVAAVIFFSVVGKKKSSGGGKCC